MSHVLTIRAPQTTAMAYAIFVDRLCAHLRETLPDRAAKMPYAQLRGVVESGLRRAWKWGLQAEPEMACFVEYSIAWGLDFDAEEWATTILQANVPGRVKLARLDYAHRHRAGGEGAKSA